MIRQLSSEHMTAIPAVNAFHPALDEMACATYNRVHIFQ
jgi:hypothetical protein